MRGQEKLIEMRLQGLKPELVFLNDWPLNQKWSEPTDSPEISIAGESPERADLRFLVGLRVNITCLTLDRAKRFFDAAMNAGAIVVISGWSESPKRNWLRFYDKQANIDTILEDQWYAA